MQVFFVLFFNKDYWHQFQYVFKGEFKKFLKLFLKIWFCTHFSPFNCYGSSPTENCPNENLIKKHRQVRVRSPVLNFLHVVAVVQYLVIGKQVLMDYIRDEKGDSKAVHEFLLSKLYSPNALTSYIKKHQQQRYSIISPFHLHLIYKNCTQISWVNFIWF